MIRVPVYHRFRGLVAHALIDDEDQELVMPYRWCLDVHGYVVTYLPETFAHPKYQLRLHRLLLELPYGDRREGDHEDHNPLNNQRSNIRIATKAQNGQNQKGLREKSSVYRGVFRCRGKWIAQGRLNYKAYHIGSYDTEQEANQAAIAWRAEHMPFAVEQNV
jgi:hypothetical protein